MIGNGEFEYVRHLLTKDGVSYQLRPARVSDTDQIAANISAVCAEKIYLYTDEFVVTDEWQDALANSVDEESGRLLIVAEVNEQVVGHLRLFSAWYGAKSRHVGEVGLAVIEPWRERGIGKVLLDYALKWAVFAGFQKATATVFANNQRAINLFSLYNFTQEGCRTKQLLVEGNFVDEVLLGKLLQSYP
jgi:RimJ/RimL family protein N-acetyltransferase